MNRLNDYAEIMTEHLAECFVDLCGHSLAAKSLTKLRLDHVESRFHVGSLVVSGSGILRGCRCRNPASESRALTSARSWFAI